MTLTSRILAVAVVFLTVLPIAMSHSVPAPSKNCKSNEFWYDESSCCLPHGGPPSPPPPPKGSDCPPTNYYWGQNQGCCVPSHPPPPNNPPPQCRNGWTWYPALRKCLPSPTPPSPPPSHPSGSPNSGSGHGNGHNYKRASLHKSRSGQLCPSGLDACAVSSSDYQCVDIETDLEFCGGCVASGVGQNCNAIKGAWNVGCEQGRCAVYTCAGGFKRNREGTSCIAI
ncbi:hypothetical protein BD779DRAFT_1464831 [Infundibulicybe gibba]|nr:hypothetical protein BD779DRAFT_1464831 [Infundibulicybe gibba]